MVGHDTGYIIGYALAADHRDRVTRVALAEISGPPGCLSTRPLFVSGPIYDRVWHIPFNRVNDELDRTARQGTRRNTRPLTIPVLGIGGAESWGESAGEGMKPAATDVQTVVIPTPATGSPSRSLTRCWRR